jgi:hypothetical protein
MHSKVCCKIKKKQKLKTVKRKFKKHLDENNKLNCNELSNAHTMLWQLEWTDMNDIGTPFMQAVNCMNKMNCVCV